MNRTPASDILRSTRFWKFCAVGVGHNEQATPGVVGAALSRREQARRDAVAQAAKRAGDVGKAQGDVALDVLEEDAARFALPDDALDRRPEVARIVAAASLSGCRERLAGVAGREDIHAATPRAAVEGESIVPDRRVTYRLVRHPGHENGRGEGVPLDVADSAVAGFCEADAELQASSSGAQRYSVEGISAWGM